ncbi:hypothetical protein H9L39_05137 [Fusarium oxysporum f. sp. albedinis]|nr:hypothetical protein H9L39_05137 [Fusarium oxysporum f. sp. albedinis]
MYAIDNLSPLCYHVGSALALNTFKAYNFDNFLLAGELQITLERADSSNLRIQPCLRPPQPRNDMPSSQPRGPAHADLTPEGFSRINIVSDFLPLTIPLVLQKVVRDPYVAWDIRSIEIWVDQLTWDFWDSSGSKSRKA